MRLAILGTAGHIDHGKTTLIKALTGTDTDRLKEEKERGITIDLGFAELQGDGVRLGVVDVPGHEGFVRNMLAGATGMDLALLVVAADEGVMPQTREHLAILGLLGVPRLVVALTKVDLVEEAWLELVEDDVRETLDAAGFADASLARVSAPSGVGVDDLRQLLLAVAARLPDPAADLLALPVDRVFTVRGTGTVVTGTLASGVLSVGDRVRLLPSDLSARVRGLQVHGDEVDRAEAGSRTAVALSGDDIDRRTVSRGELVVADRSWRASHMLTVSFRVVPDTGWSIAHNQRVRVHLGTAEVMARCVVFGDDEVAGGREGWGQLRLEAPVATRVGAAGVLRSYSPVTTIAGIRVVEAPAPKRGRATDPAALRLATLLEGSVDEAVATVLEVAGPTGVAEAELPLCTGRTPDAVQQALGRLAEAGADATPSGVWIGVAALEAIRDTLLASVDAVHRDQAYRPGVPVDALRALLPGGAAEGAADLVLARARSAGTLTVSNGMVARAGFQPRLTPQQASLRDDLLGRFRGAGLTPPFLAELPSALRDDPAFAFLVAGLIDDGELVALDHELHVCARALQAAVDAVRSQLGGRSELGPADFREAIPVTRRHLLPILAWMDRRGITHREGDRRSVRP